MRTAQLTMTAAAALAFVGTLTFEADAQSRRARGGDGAVSACSRYGNGCTNAPVRRGAVGLEFRMPGGTWVNCRADCKEALREEVLDFWETQQERQPSGSFGR